ncbi:MAG TPA: helix-turn-helix domain-containing protein [Candidatus Angelobacter sp.]|nr:helix-turn-helix domain-containing protein [Candidatus Angelobacter sp.]
MSEEKLSSWKEIAAYLKCDESTARRWERKNGLPVHRVGSKGGSVYAYPQEIEAWVRGGGLNGPEVDTLQEGPKPSGNHSEIEQALPDLWTLDQRPPSVVGQSPAIPSSGKRRRYSLLGAITIISISGLWIIINSAGRHRAEAQPRSDSTVPAWRLSSVRADQNSSGSAIHKATKPDELDESEISGIKALVKESQIWEMLTLYSAPWNCDAKDIERYWLPGSKAYLDVGKSVSRLNERGTHYGFDAKLLNFEFRYVKISRDGLSANIGTVEHWWLPVYTRDETLVTSRNPDQGPYEIDYLLIKVNDHWYLKSTTTPYTQWTPQKITCKNWPEESNRLADASK